MAKHYAAMIEALSMVIVYLQADFQHLALGPAIAAYVSLMNLKEAVGMERAIVGGMLAGKTERFTASSYSDLVRSQPHHPVSLLLRPGALPTPPPGQPSRGHGYTPCVSLCNMRDRIRYVGSPSFRFDTLTVD